MRASAVAASNRCAGPSHLFVGQLIVDDSDRVHGLSSLRHVSVLDLRKSAPILDRLLQAGEAGSVGLQTVLSIPWCVSLVFRTSSSIAAIATRGRTLAPTRIGANE